MNNSTSRFLKGLSLVGLMALVVPASAAGTDHYFDGTQRRSITAQPDLVAQFGNADERSQALGSQATAVPVAGDSLVRIYRLNKVVARGSAATSGATDTAGAVYREGNSPAGRLMALPGGVLVKFKPDWTRDRIDVWLTARGLSVERKLGIEPNWFKIATPGGDASLATANALFGSGEVLAAVPNWWKQTRTR